VIHLAGCGKSGQLALYPTTGVVTLNGTPVARASVVFSPANAASGSVATGLTDGSGRFALSTAGREGAAQGPYTVTVFAQENARPTGGPMPSARGPSGDGLGLRSRPKLLVPERYTIAEQSGLTFTIEPKRNNFEIKLVAENRK
jgi:hypothetical protein